MNMSDSKNSDNQVRKKPSSLRSWLGLDRAPIALAFTDIVGSTEMAIGMGDRSWINVLMKHFKKARHYTVLNGGYEVKLIGDACMVAFRTADAALEFAMAFAGDTGDPEISIRAGIHVGDVRVVENDIYGVMVNYTFRVQHAMKGSGIAISAPAKLRIEHELGGNIRGRFNLMPLTIDEPLKGFPEDQQTLWQITFPEPLPSTIGNVKFDEYGNVNFDDEKARLDNFAIQLQNSKGATGHIRVYGSRPGEASNRAIRAKNYLVNERGMDPNLIVPIDGGVSDTLTVQLYVGDQAELTEAETVKIPEWQLEELTYATELTNLEIQILQLLSDSTFKYDVEGISRYLGEKTMRIEYHLGRLESEGYVQSTPVLIGGMVTTYYLTQKGRGYLV